MTEASGNPVYEFDAALSFAGEDREYVEEIADRLKAQGLRVFYDTDYQTDMWGEDLVEYLDEIYRVKARYAVMFISRFYAGKMWTRHERRSAFARALEQKSEYVLPVRLDSTPLDGFRPTVGYLDARRFGLDGIAKATLTKVKGAAPAASSAISRTPRTEAERQQVLAQRPPLWEFFYFAGQLLHQRDSVEPKYRDHEIHYASSGGESITDSDVFDYIIQRADDAQRLTALLNSLVNDEAIRERAFGEPGEPGDPERIAHLARRWNSVYEEFMDWATNLRGVSASSRIQPVLDLLARFVDGPVEQYRKFVDSYVAQVDALPVAMAADEPLRIEVSLILSIEDEIVEAFQEELSRIASQP